MKKESKKTQNDAADIQSVEIDYPTLKNMYDQMKTDYKNRVGFINLDGELKIVKEKPVDTGILVSFGKDAAIIAKAMGDSPLINSLKVNVGNENRKNSTVQIVIGERFAVNPVMEALRKEQIPYRDLKVTNEEVAAYKAGELQVISDSRGIARLVKAAENKTEKTLSAAEPEIKTSAKKSAKKSSAKTAKAKNETSIEKPIKRAEKSTREETSGQVIQQRDPQMVTANGQNITHAHFFQSNQDSSRWLFTAKIDGVQLRPRLADPADIMKANVAAQNGEKFPVKEMMEKYYPTKMAAKVSEKEFSLPAVIQGIDGKVHTVERLNPYKEKTLGSPDMGKWKLFTTIDGKNMSIAPDPEILSAYFDRSMPLAKIVERAFGERLHLPGAYEQYQRPQGISDGMARVHKVTGDNQRWYVSVRLDKNLSTPAKPLTYDDAGSYFAKAVTADQLAGKYLTDEIAALLEKAETKRSVEHNTTMKI